MIARINCVGKDGFPVYKKSLHSRDVIKFTDATTGIIVSKGYPNRGRPVGYCSAHLVAYDVLSKWQDLPDTEVELLGLPVLHCTLKKGRFV